jgi:hypothetical protein
VILTTRLIPAPHAAITLGPLILVRPEYRDDAGLIAHERVHQRQQRRGWWIPWALRYLLDRRFRLAQEVEAYSEQLRHYPDDRSHQLAAHLAQNYRLNITPQQAREVLTLEVNAMPEPHITTGVVLGAGIGSVTGSLLGAQIDALIVGLMASILVSFAWPTIDDKRKAASAVAFASLAAGYLAPLLSAYLPTLITGLSNNDQLRLATALVIGAAAPTVTPLIFRALLHRLEEPRL